MKHNKLLIVDDEEAIISVLRGFLDQETDFECHYANSSDEAIQLFTTENIDVVLTDIKMPGLNGIALIGELRKINPHVQVIAMSAYGDVEEVIEALRAGVVDFFQKPFRIHTALESLRRAFQRVNVVYSADQTAKWIAKEEKELIIPNSFEAASQVTMELTRNMTPFDLDDEFQLESIRVALNEIIVNAIEHGNLEISYEEKNKLIENFENYRSVIEQRSVDSRYKDRRVLIRSRITSNEARFIIEDEGKGFAHDNLPDPTDVENLMNSHGRGILMARIYMDELLYNEKGNVCTIVKYKNNPNAGKR
ncbi:response regulator [Candidatus Sumerlaeota bacterium]|nr:response regulator [Candidatus Sumerlaeota bacterium]